MFSPGDILLYTAPALRFNNLLAKAVRLIQGNKVEHVAIYLGANDMGHVIAEALTDGVKIKTLSDSEIYSRNDGFVLYGTASLPNLKVSMGNKVFIVAVAKYTDSPYGYLTDFNLFLQHGKTLLFPKKPWTIWCKSKKGYICSEVAQLVISDVLRLNGFDVPFKKVPALTEPDDFLQDPWIVKQIEH